MTRSRPRRRRASTATPAFLRPEAELEARIVTALASAFPNIPRDQLLQQRRFTVRLGHNTFEFSSDATWEQTGRADIILFHEDRPLAVLEVKRETLPLTDDDRGQAQSYANQITPRPPLVVVTNGSETRVYDSSSGAPWEPEGSDAAAVSALLAGAAKVAAADMRWAVEALMGRETGVWPEALRSCTTTLLQEMTDPPGESGLPFARDLLFPRRATQRVQALLGQGSTFAVVTGVPVAGKTSVLREFALRADESEFCVLMLRGTGRGLFQELANLFSVTFEWSMSANDARQWLRRMSTAGAGPTLVVAVDGVDPGSSAAADLEELASLRPGPKLKVVLSTDRADGLLRAPNGRTQTALGAHAGEVEVGPLGLQEFRAAKEVLESVGIAFFEGADYAEDYRAPWVLRAIYDAAARHPSYSDPARGLLLPATLGLEWIDTARAAYDGYPDLQRGYRVLARDAIADAGAASTELALMGSNGFVIRQDALSAEGRDQLATLRDQGWVRTGRMANQDVVTPTAPAAFLVELADAAGEELGRRANADPEAAGVWLGRRLDAVYLGDLVGAQAIRSLADATGGFSSGILSGLISIEPKEELVEDALIAFAASDGAVVHLKIENGQARLADRHGVTRGEPVDLGSERSRMYGDTTPWMILAQFARLPTAPVGDDRARVDASLLMQIGRCPFPLLRANAEGLGHLEHDLGDLGRVICQEAGAVESITLAMADLLVRPWEDDDAFIEAVRETGDLPLLHRLMIALRTVRQGGARDRASWAHKRLSVDIVPAVQQAISRRLDREFGGSS